MAHSTSPSEALSRVQDDHERTKNTRPPNHIRLSCPAPLADILYSLGYYFEPSTGVNYHLTPPAQASVLEDFWGQDPVITAGWIRLCRRYERLYAMREMPLARVASDFNRKPIILPTPAVVNDYVTVKTKLNHCEMSHGLIHAVDDHLFPNACFTFANSHITIFLACGRLCRLLCVKTQTS